jgi:ElaB/YqjD/DUF883 family membrane-anchored ribosome-binding protein
MRRPSRDARGGRHIDELGARVQTGLRDGRSEVSAVKSQLMSRAHDGRVRVEREVREHPVRVLAYAFGIGAIAGILLSRRSRS